MVHVHCLFLIHQTFLANWPFYIQLHIYVCTVHTHTHTHRKAISSLYIFFLFKIKSIWLETKTFRSMLNIMPLLNILHNGPQYCTNPIRFHLIYMITVILTNFAKYENFASNIIYMQYKMKVCGVPVLYFSHMKCEEFCSSGT